MKYATILGAISAAVAPVSAALDWQNVKIGGGGGFVPGISFHPTEPGLAYARTDIGGLYRLNPEDDSWIPVTDSISDNANWGRWGIDAMALDPQDPDKVYAAVGMYTNSWDPNNGAIISSSDRGSTWSITDLPFKVGGNMPGRGMGERLAVDPLDPSVIYFGARSGKGLYRSTDSGATFEKVESFTAVGTFIPDPADVGGYNGDIHGLAFVTFDETSGAVEGGSATKRIFVGTADNTTASVYVSEDAGETWAPVAGQPGTFFPHKCRLQPEEKALYLSYSDGSGPYDGTLGAVYRYDLESGTWTDITPVTGEDLFYGFGGLSVDLQNPGTLMVASLNSWWPDAQIFRSTDSGATWSQIWEWAWPDQVFHYGISTPRAPWINENFLSVDSKRLGWMIEALEIDPTDSDHWLYATGLTVFGGRDLTKWDSGPGRNVTIESLADGIEEFAVLEVTSVPGGTELLAAVGDDSGFSFKSKADLGTSPKTAWNNPMFTSSTSVDFAGNDINKIVRTGNSGGSPQVALSTDGGATWNLHPSAADGPFGGRVAYSADADTIVWSSDSVGGLRSSNGGPFEPLAAVPKYAAVASDKRDNKYFYAGATEFLVSSDSGATFAKGGALSGVTSIRDIAVHPLIAGELFVSTDKGIFHSGDFGATFHERGDLTNTHRISLGVGEGDSWILYAFGTGASGARLYASADGGETWVDVQGDRRGFGSIDSCRVSGSANEPGLVYVGTNGRGVFYAEVAVEGGEGGGHPTTVAPEQSTTETVTEGPAPTETDDECEEEDSTTTEDPSITAPGETSSAEATATPTDDECEEEEPTSSPVETSAEATASPTDDDECEEEEPTSTPVETSSAEATPSPTDDDECEEEEPTSTPVETTSEEATPTPEPTTPEPTTLSTSTRSTTTTTSEDPAPTGGAKRWEQCGGINWTGVTHCEEPWKCTWLNDWYFQCL